MKFEFKLPPENNTDLVPEYRDFLEKSLNEALTKRWEMIESLMLLYMAGTGFRPDQLELCQEDVKDEGEITMKWFIRPHSGTKITEEGKADPCHVQLSPLS